MVFRWVSRKDVGARFRLGWSRKIPARLGSESEPSERYLAISTRTAQSVLRFLRFFRSLNPWITKRYLKESGCPCPGTHLLRYQYKTDSSATLSSHFSADSHGRLKGPALSQNIQRYIHMQDNNQEHTFTWIK